MVRPFKGASEGREGTSRGEDWLAGCWQLGPAWLLATQAHGQHRPSRWAAEALKRQGPPGTARGWRRGLAGPSSPWHKPERSQRPQLCLWTQRYMLVCSLNSSYPPRLQVLKGPGLPHSPQGLC